MSMPLFQPQFLKRLVDASLMSIFMGEHLFDKATISRTMQSFISMEWLTMRADTIVAAISAYLDKLYVTAVALIA